MFFFFFKLSKQCADREKGNSNILSPPKSLGHTMIRTVHNLRDTVLTNEIQDCMKNRLMFK